MRTSSYCHKDSIEASSKNSDAVTIEMVILMLGCLVSLKIRPHVSVLSYKFNQHHKIAFPPQIPERVFGDQAYLVLWLL